MAADREEGQTLYIFENPKPYQTLKLHKYTPLRFAKQQKFKYLQLRLPWVPDSPEILSTALQWEHFGETFSSELI